MSSQGVREPEQGLLCRHHCGHGVEVGGAGGEGQRASTPCGAETMSGDRPRPCPPLLPSMSGLAAYSPASLLFWFNKTKSGGLGGRDGGLPCHTLTTTPRSLPEPSSSWSSQAVPWLSLCYRLPSHVRPSAALLRFPRLGRHEGERSPNGMASS